jgi:hypothetical protein
MSVDLITLIALFLVVVFSGCWIGVIAIDEKWARIEDQFNALWMDQPK